MGLQTVSLKGIVFILLNVAINIRVDCDLIIEQVIMRSLKEERRGNIIRGRRNPESVRTTWLNIIVVNRTKRRPKRCKAHVAM